MANKLNCAIWAVYLTFGHTNPTTGGAAVSQKLYTQNVFFHRLPSRPLRTGTLCEFTTFSAHITIQDRIFHDNKVKTVRHFFSSSFSILARALSTADVTPVLLYGPGDLQFNLLTSSSRLPISYSLSIPSPE